MGIIHADGTGMGIYSSVSLSITSIGVVWFPVNSYAGVIVDTQLKTVFHGFDVQVAFWSKSVNIICQLPAFCNTKYVVPYIYRRSAIF